MQVKLTGIGDVTLVEIPNNVLKNANLQTNQVLNISTFDGVVYLSPIVQKAPPIAKNTRQRSPHSQKEMPPVSINTLIKYSSLKKTMGFNDNIASIALHLNRVGIDTLNNMKEIGVIPTHTRCFKDLGTKINEYIVSRKVGGNVTVTSNAKLTQKGKSLVEKLIEANVTI